MQLAKFCEGLVALAEPLGVKLMRLSTDPGEAGGVVKVFLGVRSKNAATSAHDKLLVATVITITQVGSTTHGVRALPLKCFKSAWLRVGALVTVVDSD